MTITVRRDEVLVALEASLDRVRAVERLEEHLAVVLVPREVQTDEAAEFLRVDGEHVLLRAETVADERATSNLEALPPGLQRDLAAVVPLLRLEDRRELPALRVLAEEQRRRVAVTVGLDAFLRLVDQDLGDRGRSRTDENRRPGRNHGGVDVGENASVVDEVSQAEHFGAERTRAGHVVVRRRTAGRRRERDRARRAVDAGDRGGTTNRRRRTVDDVDRLIDEEITHL